MTRSQYALRIGKDPMPERRLNHGKPWDTTEQTRLRYLWLADTPFHEICETMGRSYDSIISRLQTLRLVNYDSVTRTYSANRALNPSTESPAMEKTERTGEDDAPNIETKTFMNGVDASKLSDAAIFQRIANIEREIDKLKAIRTKSKKLAATIKQLEDDVAKLAAYVDGR